MPAAVAILHCLTRSLTILVCPPRISISLRGVSTTEYSIEIPPHTKRAPGTRARSTQQPENMETEPADIKPGWKQEGEGVEGDQQQDASATAVHESSMPHSATEQRQSEEQEGGGHVETAGTSF